MDKVHLKQDLDLNKSAILRNVTQFINGVDDKDERLLIALNAVEMLNKRTQYYTVEEASLIIDWYITSHDECVWENEEDFSPLQVYAANKKMQKYEQAVIKLDNLKK